MKLSPWVTGLAAIIAVLGANAGSIRAREFRDEESAGLVTLYSGDPITHDYSFASARHGGYFEDNMVKNAGADVDYSVWYSGELTVGLDARTKGQILDLGGADVLQEKYRYDETPGGGQGFASIRRDSAGHFLILRDYARQTTQILGEARLLPRAANHAPVVSNHVYLIRIATTDAPPSERFVKLLVVKHEPGASVTFRWAVVD
jgi:hypothetical protein